MVDEVQNSSLSVDRLLKLHDHCRTESRTLRTWSALVLTPLLAVLLTFLLDALPLEAPSRGVVHSHSFWVRTWFFYTIMAAVVIVKLHRLVSAIRWRWRFGVVVTAVTATTTTLSIFVLALSVGYPVPFAILGGAPGFVTPFVLLLCWHVGRRGIRDHWKALRMSALVLTIQCTQIIIYPAFTVLLGTVKPPYQPYFVLVLSVIKVGYKIVLANAMDGVPDLKPLFIVLNAELFHALFVSMSMQSSPSRVTLSIITAINVLISCRTLYEIRRRSNKLNIVLSAKSGAIAEIPTTEGLPPLLDCAALLLQETFVREAILAATTTQRSIPHRACHAIVPVRGANTTASAPTTVFPSRLTSRQQAQLRNLAPNDKVAFVLQTLELLSKTQAYLFTEYVEVIVPLVFALFFNFGSQFPNHSYYRLFRGSSRNARVETTTRILLYAALELATFLPLDSLLSTHVGFHPIHQLTFLLRHEWLLIQSELTLWLVFMQQTALDHYGYDFSFRFAWLHRKGGSP